jgi:hypothetical protein
MAKKIDSLPGYEVTTEDAYFEVTEEFASAMGWKFRGGGDIISADLATRKIWELPEEDKRFAQGMWNNSNVLLEGSTIYMNPEYVAGQLLKYRSGKVAKDFLTEELFEI